MKLDLDKVSESAHITGDELVHFRDRLGEESRIDCHVELDVRRMGQSFYVDGVVIAAYGTECDRCLAPTTVEIQPVLKLVIHRSIRRDEQAPDWEDEDFVHVPFGQSELSLDRYIHENVVVNVPIQVYCREDCKGLCPQCGCNLNEEKCGCAGEADPRWNALRDLKQKRDE